jgi:DNA gyrase/topoisomerase IV subunit A
VKKSSKSTVPEKLTALKITPISLVEFSVRNTKIYGGYTVEQRALADFRDGLKPVHRRILWAMHKLGLHATSGFKKCARTVGDVIGKYHPHGDTAAYDALVGLAASIGRGGKVDWKNCPLPLIDGQGNFGGIGPEDSAAAMRYTESRLSKFSDEFLLDPEYLAVMDMVPNFDGEEREPVILPAKLPILLLNGSEGIATGVSSLIPSFSLASVKKLTKYAIAGNPITALACFKMLKFEFENGGVCVSDKSTMAQYFKTGKATLDFLPSYEMRGNQMIITSIGPHFNIDKKLGGVAALAGVQTVDDDSDRNSGIKFVVTFKRGLSDTEHAKTVAAVKAKLNCDLRCQTAVTERLADGETVKFRYTTIPALMTAWTKWRIELESKVIAYLIAKEMTILERLTLLQLAATHLDVMRKLFDAVDARAFLQKTLKFNGARLTDEQADFLLDLRFRQLTKLNRQKLIEDIKKTRVILVDLRRDLKAPAARILRDFK